MATLGASTHVSEVVGAEVMLRFTISNNMLSLELIVLQFLECNNQPKFGLSQCHSFMIQSRWYHPVIWAPQWNWKFDKTPLSSTKAGKIPDGGKPVEGYAMVNGKVVPHISTFKAVVDSIRKKEQGNPKQARLDNNLSNCIKW